MKSIYRIDYKLWKINTRTTTVPIICKSYLVKADSWPSACIKAQVVPEEFDYGYAYEITGVSLMNNTKLWRHSFKEED